MMRCGLPSRQPEAMKHNHQRMELIDRVYWKRSHTLYGAAMCVLVSERTAHTWNAGLSG